jgi:hypothetical protein
MSLLRILQCQIGPLSRVSINASTDMDPVFCFKTSKKISSATAKVRRESSYIMGSFLWWLSSALPAKRRCTPHSAGQQSHVHFHDALPTPLQILKHSQKWTSTSSRCVVSKSEDFRARDRSCLESVRSPDDVSLFRIPISSSSTSSSSFSLHPATFTLHPFFFSLPSRFSYQRHAGRNKRSGPSVVSRGQNQARYVRPPIFRGPDLIGQPAWKSCSQRAQTLVGQRTCMEGLDFQLPAI